MVWLGGERVNSWSADSNSASTQRADSSADLETSRDAFSASSMGYFGSSDQKSPLEWPLPGEGDACVWHATRSGRLTGTVPYRMQCSCSTTNVSRHYVDTAVSEFIADLHSGLLIEASVELVAMATVDRRGMLGDLLIAFVCKGRP